MVFWQTMHQLAQITSVGCNSSPCSSGVSGTSKIFRKICLFAPLFVQYVFANFSTNIALVGLKFGRRCQWAPTMLIRWSDGSPRAFLGFRLSTHTISAKTIFHKLAKRVDTTNVTAGKIGSTCCLIGHSTATSPQLAVPVRYEALSVLQF